MSHKIAVGLKALAMPIGELWVDEDNPRRGDVPAVMRSFDRFGQRTPIVFQFKSPKPRARKRNVVIAGNHRVMAARELGWDMIAAVDADDLTAEEARAFALADNRTSDLATYDDGILGDIMADLMRHDETLVADAGFDEGAIAAILLDPARFAGDKDWADAFDGAPTGGDSKITTMTFTVHVDDVATINAAIGQAKELVPDAASSRNQNTRGNALAYIAAAYVS